MKYIKADELIQFCTSMLVEAKDDLIIQTHNNCFRHMREHIKSSPSADVRENIHGEWAKSGQSFFHPEKFVSYCCSECGYESTEKIKHNFCPNCGADMRGKT